MSAPVPANVLAGLWRAAGQDDAALSEITLTGAEPVLPSSFAVGTAAQASIAAAALAAGELWRLRSGRRQRVAVDMRAAAIEFRSERYLRVNGKPPEEYHDGIAGLYRCGDGRWVRLHTNLPHHCHGLLALLGCDHDRGAVQRTLETGRAKARRRRRRSGPRRHRVPLVRGVGRASAGARHHQVAALFHRADRRGAGKQAAGGQRPLAGIKVLDLTRIIAGPVCGRTLAGHGADVLLVTASHLPSMLPLVIDTGRGKLSTSIDLRETSGRDMLAALVREADIFVQGYRPGAIAAFGFGPQEVAKIRPGIVYVSLCAYGHEGPWAQRRGFDSLVQTASGLNLAEAEAFGEKEPRPLPTQELDHATGYVLAFAAMTALARRVERGGSWHVRARLPRPAIGCVRSAASMASNVPIRDPRTSAICWRNRRPDLANSPPCATPP